MDGFESIKYLFDDLWVDYFASKAENIFIEKYKTIDETNKRKSQEDLRSFMEELKDRSKTKEVLNWWASPSGNNYILLSQREVFFINIYGIKDIVMPAANDMFCDDGDELNLAEFYWIEEEHLVFFDLYYGAFGHKSGERRCLCHFTEEDFFCCFIITESIPIRTRSMYDLKAKWDDAFAHHIDIDPDTEIF
jgi:hypothetical protein